MSGRDRSRRVRIRWGRLSVLAVFVAVCAALYPTGFWSQPTSQDKSALRDAQSYISTTDFTFSEQQLQDQLRHDGYQLRAADYGASHVHVSWNQEAVKAARAFLHEQGSPVGHALMVKALKANEFTPAQAEYGASHVSAPGAAGT